MKQKSLGESFLPAEGFYSPPSPIRTPAEQVSCTSSLPSPNPCFPNSHNRLPFDQEIEGWEEEEEEEEEKIPLPSSAACMMMIFPGEMGGGRKPPHVLVAIALPYSM